MPSWKNAKHHLKNRWVDANVSFHLSGETEPLSFVVSSSFVNPKKKQNKEQTEKKALVNAKRTNTPYASLEVGVGVCGCVCALKCPPAQLDMCAKDTFAMVGADENTAFPRAPFPCAHFSVRREESEQVVERARD